MKRVLLHGGRLDEAIAAYGGDVKSWLDLSTCINPFNYSVRDLRLSVWRRLPDVQQTNVCKQAAIECLNLSSKVHISFGGGSQSHIQLLPTFFKPQSVAIIGFTYGEHARCWQRAGHKIYLSDGLESAAMSAKIIIVVNPNNPDGKLYSADDLLSLAKVLRRRGGLLIVDEAFGDLTPEHSIAAYAGESNIIVLRSFSKFYGLGGVRLGMALSNEARGKQLVEALGPWPVSGAALFLGAKALADKKWQVRTRKKLKKIRADMESLFNLNGIKIIGGTDLFLLLRHSQANLLAQHFLQHKILVRTFAERPHWLRIGMVKNESIERIDKAIASFMQ